MRKASKAGQTGALCNRLERQRSIMPCSPWKALSSEVGLGRVGTGQSVHSIGTQSPLKGQVLFGLPLWSS